MERRNLQNQLNIPIEELKENYYTKFSSRLVDHLTSAKTYWSILKRFLNNKKIPCITSLFHENTSETSNSLFSHFFNKSVLAPY